MYFENAACRIFFNPKILTGSSFVNGLVGVDLATTVGLLVKC